MKPPRQLSRHLLTRALAALAGLLFFTAGFVSLARAQDEYWSTGAWSACDTTCGEGSQTREVLCCLPPSCASIVPDDQCAALGSRPAGTQACTATESCDYTWQTGPWGECSADCDGGGLRTREVTCVDPNPEDGSELLFCDPLTAPATQEYCYTGQTCNDSPGPDPASDCTCSASHRGPPPSVLWLAGGLLLLFRRRSA